MGWWFAVALLVALVLGVIGLVRMWDAYVPLSPEGRRVWLGYVVVGGLLFVAGAVLLAAAHGQGLGGLAAAPWAATRAGLISLSRGHPPARTGIPKGALWFSLVKKGVTELATELKQVVIIGSRPGWVDRGPVHGTRQPRASGAGR